MKKQLLYWIPHIALLWAMVGSAIYYLVDTPTIIEIFTELGYPTYTIYFNATAKIVGGIAILFPVPYILKEWAYAGYLFIMLLALQAIYLRLETPDVLFMLVFIIIWALSYWAFKTLR